jgi:hypothetical protein
MMLRLVPVLVKPIVVQVTDLIERGYDGVKLFAEGMELIGLGHIAARFVEKYGEKLASIQKKQKEAAALAKAAPAAAAPPAEDSEGAGAAAGRGWTDGGSTSARGRGRARGGRGTKKRARSVPAEPRPIPEGPQGPYNAPALTYEQAAPDVDSSNEQEAVRQAMADHNVVKFIGTTLISMVWYVLYNCCTYGGCVMYRS